MISPIVCTVNCPAYGVPSDYERFCPSYCERLEATCDSEVLQCIKNVGIDLTAIIGCAAKDDDRCFKPELIPASGKFEYDLCFYGNPDRCMSQGTSRLFILSVYESLIG